MLVLAQEAHGQVGHAARYWRNLIAAAPGQSVNATSQYPVNTFSAPKKHNLKVVSAFIFRVNTEAIVGKLAAWPRETSEFSTAGGRC